MWREDLVAAVDRRNVTPEIFERGPNHSLIGMSCAVPHLEIALNSYIDLSQIINAFMQRKIHYLFGFSQFTIQFRHLILHFFATQNLMRPQVPE